MGAITDADTENAEISLIVSEADVEGRDQSLSTLQEIREQFRQIEKAIACRESRFILRVLRSLPNTRRKANGMVLKSLALSIYPPSGERDLLISLIPQVSTHFCDQDNTKNRPVLKFPLPEVDVYFTLLLLVRLIDENMLLVAIKCSEMLLKKCLSHNRRTIDLLAAKSIFYYCYIAELTDNLQSIRSCLHSNLRTSFLRNDYEGQAVIINCLLRNYLHFALYDRADKLVKKSVFPESASNNEWARFLYYLGRIKAAKLEYSVGHKHLVQALRKAPQNAAVGFRQTVQKLIIVVELLLGNIPEREVFRHGALRKALTPYFQLTQAVRMGNLKRFGEVVNNFGEQFQQDFTYTLIIRLRHNVIKTAIRSIGLSYSRISPSDIAKKLVLDSAEDSEFIVSKAIRDGVIEASLDSVHNYLKSKESTDIYSTREPQLAFHERITFCLVLHNQSVKAMRYPPKSYGKDLENAEERREREQQDLELAKEMAEEDDEGF